MRRTLSGSRRGGQPLDVSATRSQARCATALCVGAHGSVRRVLADAAAAGAMEHDLVLGDVERHPSRRPFDGALESLVPERLEPPAAIAHQVVVMCGALHEGLISRDAGTDVDALDGADLLELLED